MSEAREAFLIDVIHPLESGRRPPGGVSSETEGVPSLGGENIHPSGRMVYSNVNRIALEYANLMKKGRLQSGDTLINKDGAQTGKVAQYNGDFEQAWVNEHVFILRPRVDRIDADFLFYSVLDGSAQRLISRRITGSAQPGLNSDFVRAVQLTVPCNLHAQSLIARVLKLVDAQIDATEALIAKQKRLRVALMQDLFTRGIDENGELRPPREEAPHLYHETELGWLPDGWEPKRLSEACELIRDGTHLPPPRTQRGPLLLSVQNIIDGKLALTSGDTRVPESFFATMHRNWTIKPSDTLLAIVGATLGKTCTVPEHFPKFTLQRSVCVLRGQGEELLPPFLALCVRRPQFQTKLWQKANQTAQPGVYLDQIGEIAVPRPPREEQDRICGPLHNQDDRIEQLKGELAKLKLQKKGLMQDLLTGTVSIEPLLEKEPA